MPHILFVEEKSLHYNTVVEVTVWQSFCSWFFVLCSRFAAAVLRFGVGKKVMRRHHQNDSALLKKEPSHSLSQNSGLLRALATLLDLSKIPASQREKAWPVVFYMQKSDGVSSSYFLIAFSFLRISIFFSSKLMFF